VGFAPGKLNTFLFKSAVYTMGPLRHRRLVGDSAGVETVVSNGQAADGSMHSVDWELDQFGAWTAAVLVAIALGHGDDSPASHHHVTPYRLQSNSNQIE
jgi:hypothetical protein